MSESNWTTLRLERPREGVVVLTLSNARGSTTRSGHLRAVGDQVARDAAAEAGTAPGDQDALAASRSGAKGLVTGRGSSR